ncbi:cell wall-binding repeat-containing protein [Gryllotalpicola protaetiae]|uniref:cell wall-binding repeat-containing protein n=1 Tax=Gryllotalpicola protaetiae TaxID=2419771 RepID=UPI0013C40CCF|nr:cell wall-binding repeat-containing protein [Gryllotalpicola protaetiae]
MNLRVPASVLAVSALAVALLTAATVAPAAATSGSITTSRVSGADRYATAVAVAQDGYPNTAPVVFIAAGTNFPDALGAGPAAAKLGGPLLLTPPGGLPDEVVAELKHLNPGTIDIIGGTAAIPDPLFQLIQAAVPGATVNRLAGADRYATSRAVVGNVFTTAHTAYLATGANYPDALSAAAAAGSQADPVILINGSATTLDSDTLAEFAQLGVTDVVIAGGPVSISAAIEGQLDSLLGAAHVTRLGGADRYETSALIGAHSFTSATKVYLAAGTEFPDALAGSAVAGALHAPLLTVQPGCVPYDSYADLTALGVTHATLIGGTAALSSSVDNLRKCDPELSIVAGVARAPHPGPSTESSIDAVDTATDHAGNVYVLDATALRIEKITPTGQLSFVAGNGTTDDPTPGAAIDSGLGSPTSLAVDGAGDLYLCTQSRIVKITTAGTLSYVAGDGTYGASVPGPAMATPMNADDLVVDSAGDIFFIDASNDTVDRITPSGSLSIVAGDGSWGALSPGPALDSDLSPSAVAVDSAGDLFIDNFDDKRVAKVTASGVLSIVAGDGSADVPRAGSATATGLGELSGVAVDSVGNVFIGDTRDGDNYLEKISPSGQLSIIAGTGSYGDPVPGPAAASPITYPQAFSVDTSGNLFFADDGVLEEVTASGTLALLSSLAAGEPKPGPADQSPLGMGVFGTLGLATDSAGAYYIADATNSVIEKVDASGTLSIVAGGGARDPRTPGPAKAAQLFNPQGVAVDGAGNLYIADTHNALIEKVTPAGQMSVIAGDESFGTATPGPATNSALVGPLDVAVDAAGNVYANDGAQILKITPLDMLSVFAGNGSNGAPIPGPAASSPLGSPWGMALDSSGTLYIADASSSAVEKVSPSGVLSIAVSSRDVAGSRAGSTTDFFPLDVAVDRAGDIFIADGGYPVVEERTASGTITAIAGTGSWGNPAPGRALNSSLNPESVALGPTGELYLTTGADVVKLSW